MKIYCSICIFLCASFSIEAQSDAWQHYEKSDFVNAAVQFEFEIFKSTENDEKNDLLFMKYLCYKNLSKYTRALATISRIRYVRSDSVKARIGYEKALIFYLQGELSKSNLELQRTIGNPYNDTLDRQIIQVLVGVDQLKWNETREQLLNGEVFDFTIEEVDEIISSKLKPKNRRKAENLSLIPGLGQWYAGYFWKGATSGFIQAAIGGFMVYSLVEGYVLSGTLTGAAGLYTFNLGGARHAGELADKKNAEISSQIKERFLRRIGDFGQ